MSKQNKPTKSKPKTLWQANRNVKFYNKYIYEMNKYFLTVTCITLLFNKKKDNSLESPAQETKIQPPSYKSTHYMTVHCMFISQQVC